MSKNGSCRSIGGVITYYGGDSRIAKRIVQEILPRGATLVEAFGGGGSVTLTAAGCNAFKKFVLNDADTAVYAAYRVVRDMQELHNEIAKQIERLSRLNIVNPKRSKKIIKKLYEEAHNPKLPLARRGKAMIIAYTVALPDTTGIRLRKQFIDSRNVIKLLQRKSQLLQKVKLHNMDALNLLHKYGGSSTVFYLDPPYVEDSHSKAYYRGFTEKQAYNLAKAIAKSSSRWVLKLRPYDWHNYYKPILNTTGIRVKRVKYTVYSNINNRGKKRFYYFIIK